MNLRYMWLKSLLYLTLVSFCRIALGIPHIQRQESDGSNSLSRKERSVDRRNVVADDGSQTYNCTQCAGAGSVVHRDAKRNYRLESIKEDILRKLHLRAPPNITGRSLPVLPHIQQLIDKLSTPPQGDEPMGGDEGWTERPGEGRTTGRSGWNTEADDDRAMTMKVIQFSKPVPTDRILDSSQSNNTCYFPFPMSEIRHANQIVRINFGVYVRHVGHSAAGSATTWLLVYMLRPNGERQLLKRRVLTLSPVDTGKWYHFQFTTQEIQHWINDPSSNYGLHILSSNGRGEPLAVVTPANDSEEPFRPYIEVSTNDVSNARAKKTLT